MSALLVERVREIQERVLVSGLGRSKAVGNTRRVQSGRIFRRRSGTVISERVGEVEYLGPFVPKGYVLGMV